jgi:hypothetical protein
LKSLTFKAAVLAIGLGAIGSTSSMAAVAPAPAVSQNSASAIRVAAMGTLGASGQSLAQSPVQLAQRRGQIGRGFRGPRTSTGRGFRGNRGWNRGWRGGRYYRGGGRYYGRGWRSGRRWYGGRWIGPAIVAGTAALLIGGSIAESRASYGDRWERCADRFRSFRWSDGTYQPYGDNPRRLCPYLRR